MGKHSLQSRKNMARACVSLAAAGSVLTGVIAPAHADEPDTLLAEIEKMSSEASAKMEEVKELENKLADAQRQLDESAKHADEAQLKIAQANENRASQQKDLNGVASTSYRSNQVDSYIGTLTAASPQNAIDKTAYLGALGRKKEAQLAQMRAADQAVIQTVRDADLAKAQAEFNRNKLDATRNRLDRERGDIEGRIKEVEARVDALTPEQRDAWVKQDKPINEPNLSSADSSGVAGAALAKLGSPYGWGATGPSAFDCSGLMSWAYAQNGVSIPRTSQAQLAGGQKVSLSDLQPGDIIGYYPGVTHVGMYIGNGQVVHASDYGIPVQVVPLNSMPIQGATRY